MARSTTTGIMLIFGILFLLWTVLMFGASLSIYEEDFFGIALGCNTLNILITVILLGGWYVRKKREDRMDDLVGYLKMYRRVHISKVAQRLGLDNAATEKVLLKCISKGQIKGFLDRKTDEFILEESISDMREGAKCPNCGGYSDKVALPGEVLNCNYCGAIIPRAGQPQAVQPVARPQAAPPPAPAPVQQVRAPPPRQGTGPILHCPGCGRALPLNCSVCPYCGRPI